MNPISWGPEDAGLFAGLGERSDFSGRSRPPVALGAGAAETLQEGSEALREGLGVRASGLGVTSREEEPRKGHSQIVS